MAQNETFNAVSFISHLPGDAINVLKAQNIDVFGIFTLEYQHKMTPAAVKVQKNVAF